MSLDRATKAGEYSISRIITKPTSPNTYSKKGGERGKTHGPFKTYNLFNLASKR